MNGTKPRFRGALFVDRDGVITMERLGYTRTVSQMSIVSGVGKVLARATRLGIPIIVITNQSAVNRGLLTRAELRRIHQSMLKQLKKQGCRIEKIYYCPHRPEENCDCRKPHPGLLLRASKDMGVELNQSCMIGDNREADLGAARQAGCLGVLVRKNDSSDLDVALGRWLARVSKTYDLPQREIEIN